MKPLLFVGRSREELRNFPANARREAGHDLDRLQRGMNPRDWKPFKTVGSGVCEIHVRDKGAYRVIYIASLPDAVYALHAFHKTTQKTESLHIELAAKRFRELMRHRMKER